MLFVYCFHPCNQVVAVGMHYVVSVWIELHARKRKKKNHPRQFLNCLSLWISFCLALHPLYHVSKHTFVLEWFLLLLLLLYLVFIQLIWHRKGHVSLSCCLLCLIIHIALHYCPLFMSVCGGMVSLGGILFSLWMDGLGGSVENVVSFIHVVRQGGREG